MTIRSDDVVTGDVDDFLRKQVEKICPSAGAINEEIGLSSFDLMKKDRQDAWLSRSNLVASSPVTERVNAETSSLDTHRHIRTHTRRQTHWVPIQIRKRRERETLMEPIESGFPQSFSYSIVTSSYLKLLACRKLNRRIFPLNQIFFSKTRATALSDSMAVWLTIERRGWFNRRRYTKTAFKVLNFPHLCGNVKP